MASPARSYVVTGGGRGIGRAISARLVDLGAGVVVVDVSEPEPQDGVVAVVGADGGGGVVGVVVGTGAVAVVVVVVGIEEGRAKWTETRNGNEKTQTNEWPGKEGRRRLGN